MKKKTFLSLLVGFAAMTSVVSSCSVSSEVDLPEKKIKIEQPPKKKSEYQTAKRLLRARNPTPSQAVILLVGAENRSAENNVSANDRDMMCAEKEQNILDLQKVFKEQNIPCHIIGNPWTGFGLKQMRRDMNRLIETHHYQAVTTIVLCHGKVVNQDKPEEYGFEEMEKRLKNDSVYHGIQTFYDEKTMDKPRCVSASSFFKAMEDERLKKNDVLVMTCYGGSIKPSDITALPEGSCVATVAGANEESMQLTRRKLCQALQRAKLADGIDGIGLLRAMLYRSAQFTEKDAMFYVSGQSEKISLDRLAEEFYTVVDLRFFLEQKKEIIETQQRRYDPKNTLEFPEDFSKEVLLPYMGFRLYDEALADHKPILQGLVFDEVLRKTERPAL